jgi:hypothetical protein
MNTEMVLKRMIEFIPTSSSHDPAYAATKSLRVMTFLSNPYVDPSLLNRCSGLFEADQAILKEFFCCNPTLARVEDVDDNKNVGETQVLVCSTMAPSNSLPPTIAATVASTNLPPEFFAQLIETMKNMQAPQHRTKIVVESRDHEETIDLAKLQNGMLQLMYATGDINWDEGTAKNIRVATFS